VKIANLQDLFMDQLKEIYSAEKQIINALPKMAKAAQSPDVRQAFEEHLETSKQQLERLNRVFEQMGANPGRKKCMGMDGLLKEADEFLGEQVAPEVMDAGLIANAQRIEHYEIAAYGTVRTFAQMMGHKEALGLLQQTLNEEGQTDQKLTQLAEHGVNAKAEQNMHSMPDGQTSGSTTSRQQTNRQTK
jgi:ferritin-like metal-binding protein YciE